MGTPAWKDDEWSEFSGELGQLSESWVRRITPGNLEQQEVPSGDGLDPTNITNTAVNLFGMGITVSGLTPNLLAQYDHNARHVNINWRLFSTSVTNIPKAGMSRVVDVSPAARFMLGWCVASHMVGKSDYLKLGYVPRHQNWTREELNRVSDTWATLTDIFLPESRLIQQAEEYGVSYKSLARIDWRLEVGKVFDVEAFITLIAQRNNCLRLIAELQLDRYSGLPLLAHVFNRLVIELPIFQFQAIKAGQMFAKALSLTQGMTEVRFSL